MAKSTRKVVITCAVTGSIHTPSMSPHLPITAEEIADAAIGAAEAVNRQTDGPLFSRCKLVHSFKNPASPDQAVGVLKEQPCLIRNGCGRRAGLNGRVSLPNNSLSDDLPDQQQDRSPQGQG